MKHKTNNNNNTTINNTTNITNTNTEPSNKTMGYLLIPYVQGLCESIKYICGKYCIQIYFQGKRKLKNILLMPKGKDQMQQKSGIIYWYRYIRLDCDQEYTGESARTFGVRFEEHLKAPSPICEHQSTTGHPTTLDNFSNVGR